MIREFSVDSLDLPITVAQLLVELGLATTQAEMRRMVWGEQILLNDTPLNTELVFFFRDTEELRGKTIKVSGKSLIRLV